MIDRLQGPTDGDPDHLPPMSSPSNTGDSPPPKIPGYTVQKPLGRGGMGEVWLAIQHGTDKQVAIKILPNTSSEKARDLFKREMRTAAALDHTNIAKVYAPARTEDQADGFNCYVMEYVPGSSLDEYVIQLVTEKALSNKDKQLEIARLMRDICRTIHYAHTFNKDKEEEQIIHRDLKPSNILVTKDGQPHIVDFGLAKVSRTQTDIQVANPSYLETVASLRGTVAYMPPERLLDGSNHIPLGPPDDIWSLGVILYQLLTGCLPFGATPDEVKKRSTERINPPSHIKACSYITRELDKICLTSLAPARGDRYQSAGSMATDLEHFLHRQTSRPRRLRRAFWTITAILLLGAILNRTVPRVPPRTPLKVVGVILSSTEHDVSIGYISGIEVLDRYPNQVVFFTRDQRAKCGGWRRADGTREPEGTPVSAWKAVINQETGHITQIDYVQKLTEVQEIRKAILESSGGLLMTGGGWCGPKPPYYSADNGNSWSAANRGIHPPNSTFCLVEFNGDIYAGTGYHQAGAEVYRWIGDGAWENVANFGTYRDILQTMAAYKDHLFVGTSGHFIEHDDNATSSRAPVHISLDGNSFAPTSGIPDDHKVWKLFVCQNRLVAFTQDRFDRNARYFYLWNPDAATWELYSEYPLGNDGLTVSVNGAIYAYGQKPADKSPGIYRSDDIGQMWKSIATQHSPTVESMTAHYDYIMMGTGHDDKDQAYLLRLDHEYTPSPNGLSFWNTMDNDDDLLNSAYGPGLMIDNGRDPSQSTERRDYIHGKHGKAITIDWDHFGSKTSHITLPHLNKIVNPERGCIELWYYQDHPPKDLSDGRYEILGGGFRPTTGVGLQVDIGVIHFGFDGANPASVEYAFAASNVSKFPNREWIHIAASWDRSGINGSQETIQLYIDGEKVKHTIRPLDQELQIGDTAIIGGGSPEAMRAFYIDNLKIWNFAKTDFTDRFNN